jgi:hypothetical protein
MFDVDNFKEVIGCWKSAAVLAADLGEKISTVEKWRTRDWIPPYQWPGVIEAAKKRRYKISYKLLASLQKDRDRERGSLVA